MRAYSERKEHDLYIAVAELKILQPLSQDRVPATARQSTLLARCAQGRESLARGDEYISTARRFKYNALIVIMMSTRVHDASSLNSYELDELGITGGVAGRAYQMLLQLARVMLGGAINGALSACGMIAREGHI